MMSTRYGVTSCRAEAMARTAVGVGLEMLPLDAHARMQAYD